MLTDLSLTPARKIQIIIAVFDNFFLCSLITMSKDKSIKVILTLQNVQLLKLRACDTNFCNSFRNTAYLRIFRSLWMQQGSPGRVQEI